MLNGNPAPLRRPFATSAGSTARQLPRRSVNKVDGRSAMSPFGGIKQPGFGRVLPLHSLGKKADLKTAWFYI
jgi:hypothetical protein